MDTEKREKTLFLGLLFVFSFALLFSIYNTFKVLNDKDKPSGFVYNEKTNTNYTVSINKNEFIYNPVLPSNETYISSLVDKINMSMKYNYSSKDVIPLKISHRVIATVSGVYNQNPVEKQSNPTIWKKDYEIIPLKEEAYKSENKIDIDESFEIDWKFYNDEINRFKESFTIPIISKLDLKMIINMESYDSDYVIKETKEINASMPLSELVFKIDAQLTEEEEKVVPLKDVDEKRDNERKALVYSFIGLMSAIMTVLTIKKLMSFNKIKSFHSRIENIKKQYNEIVVETKNMINIKGYKPIAITTFDEMLNLADSFLVPIILYEESNLACFYIVKDEVIYMYIIKNKQNKN